MLLLLTIASAITINFFLVRLMPGNPIDAMITELLMQGYSFAEASSRVQMMLNFLPTAPLHEQYIDFVKGILTGNLGYSIRLATPVTTILAYGIPWTVFSVSVSLIISFVLGIMLGMYMAYNRGSVVDRILSLYSSIAEGVPPYAVGFIMIMLFAFQLQWFPAQGSYGPYVSPGFNLDFILSVLRYATLPILTYVITSVGGWMLTMKSSTVSVLGEYYVTAAEARGLAENRIVVTYVGRNAMLPLFTRFAIALGAVFSGVVFVERLFLYRGIGIFLSTSISQRDYPLMSGCFLITTVAVVVANFLADLLYSRLDPRIKFE